jgi:hypothetical protein
MLDSQKYRLRRIFFTTLAGLTSAIAAMIVSVTLIRYTGVAWSGAVFGNDEWNWKDSLIWVPTLAAYFIATSVTASLTRRWYAEK